MQIAQSQLSAKELGLENKETDIATDTSAISGLDNEKEGM